MAGTFPDVPGHRFMYDQDGSLTFMSPISATSPLTQIDPLVLNDEDISDGPGSVGNVSTAYREHLVVFPEARDLSGIFLARTGGGSTAMWTSADTTDGSDGNWTSFGAVTNYTTLSPDWRTNITPLSISGVRGVKVRITSFGSNNNPHLTVLHLFGTVPTTANPERLEFWQPSANSILDKAGLDFGDMALGSTRTKTFRVKNLSETATAESVVISADNLSGATVNQAMVDGLEFSLDGSTWDSSATIDEIAPEAISAVVHARRVVLPAEVVNPHAVRVMAVPGVFA